MYRCFLFLAVTIRPRNQCISPIGENSGDLLHAVFSTEVEANNVMRPAGLRRAIRRDGEAAPSSCAWDEAVRGILV